MQKDNDNAILTASDLKTYFPIRGGALARVRGYVRAVDGVDLAVRRGQTLGLVGESGSGKTTVARTLLRLVPATSGEVMFDGQDVFSMRGRELRHFRKRAQVIFQDPVGSLNPRMTVGDIICEPLKVHDVVPRRRRRQRVGELLEKVGLAAAYASRYPHEFSGGQRQRVGIARALASQPDLIVCDEPVSALDVSIGAQVLNLLSDLQAQLGLSYLFIAHNLAVVEHFADEVAVMYLGRIVEIAGRSELYARPTHPYTQALLSAVPKPVPQAKRAQIALPGDVPSPITPPNGCPFHPRCPLTRELASEMAPAETARITSNDEEIRVVRRCTCQRPELAALSDDPSHRHACLMRQ